MPRLTKEQLRKVENDQRNVITVRPTTVAGGFPWLATTPFIAAAAMPALNSAGKWIGKKVFGTGVLRSGEKMPTAMKIPGGGYRSAYRSGDYPMPAMMPVQHYKSSHAGAVLTGTTTGSLGAGGHPHIPRVSKGTSSGIKKKARKPRASKAK